MELRRRRLPDVLPEDDLPFNPLDPSISPPASPSSVPNQIDISDDSSTEGRGPLIGEREESPGGEDDGQVWGGCGVDEDEEDPEHERRMSRIRTMEMFPQNAQSLVLPVPVSALLAPELHAGSMTTVETETVTLLSGKGKEYTVTRPKGAKPAAATLASADKEDFGITVHWEAQSPLCPGNIPTTSDVQDTASITDYTLTKVDVVATDACKLTFDNTKHYYYTFYDETGDYYTCDTWRNGSHSVDYTSSKPNILFVTGS
ncbi:hypothetical protein MKEN_01355000 [Mycena kentingensis (nom. inval.)]|nr:hypothetical protein MKEN_01355000 [Mycena kentingensis (nom. inval.)]